MDPNIKHHFSKKYSFIPAPNSYYPLRQYNTLKIKYQDFRSKMILKLPMPLRLSKLNNF